MKLALFFTRTVSLSLWHKTGLFFREKLIYEEHLKEGVVTKVYWLTYGVDDCMLADEFKRTGVLRSDIEVIAMPRLFNSKLGTYLYSLLMPFIHRRVLKQCDIFKTNQMDGAWSALIAKWFLGKWLIARSGFTWSIFFARKYKSKLWLTIIKLFEKLMYGNADLIMVSSDNDKQYILEELRITNKRVVILRNYVDISLFRPLEEKKYEDRLVFIGRLQGQKNLANLFYAIAKKRLKLDIYGDGEMLKELQELAKTLNIEVNFKERIPNNELPAILNKYRYYILPSTHEGMPKALLEAMACGLICIGTNVEGINEVIQDKVNGYLINGFDAESIYKALCEITRKDNAAIAINAINTIKEKYSLRIIAKQEEEELENLKNE